MILLAQRASRTAAPKTSERGVHCSEVARNGKAVPRSSRARALILPRACVAAGLRGRQRIEADFGDDLKIGRLSAHRRRLALRPPALALIHMVGAQGLYDPREAIRSWLGDLPPGRSALDKRLAKGTAAGPIPLIQE